MALSGVLRDVSMQLRRSGKLSLNWAGAGTRWSVKCCSSVGLSLGGILSALDVTRLMSLLEIIFGFLLPSWWYTTAAFTLGDYVIFCRVASAVGLFDE